MRSPESTPTLIDGGMGRELKNRGVRIPDTIWSAAALIEAPEEVSRLHGDFLDSGADVIITNNYAAVPVLLALEGLEPELEHLVDVAVDCATRARNSRASATQIAGSLPPLDQTYRPDLVHPYEDNVRDYRRIVRAFRHRTDLFVCETMSTADEARAAATAALESGVEVWASFTLADDDSGDLRDGTSPRAAVDAMVELGVDTVLFNCCRPEAITAALRRIEGHDAGRVGGYPNAMQSVPAGWALGSSSQIEIRRAQDALLLDHIDEWRDLGVTIVGGCCGIGPGTIARVREYLDAN